MPRCAALCRAVPCCAALCRAVCAYSAATLCDLVAVVGEWVGRDAQPHSELTVKAVAMRARRTRRTTPQQPKATFMVVPVGRRVGRRTRRCYSTGCYALRCRPLHEGRHAPTEPTSYNSLHPSIDSYIRTPLFPRVTSIVTVALCLNLLLSSKKRNTV